MLVLDYIRRQQIKWLRTPPDYHQILYLNKQYYTNTMDTKPKVSHARDEFHK